MVYVLCVWACWLLLFDVAAWFVLSDSMLVVVAVAMAIFNFITVCLNEDDVLMGGTTRHNLFYLFLKISLNQSKSNQIKPNAIEFD